MYRDECVFPIRLCKYETCLDDVIPETRREKSEEGGVSDWLSGVQGDSYPCCQSCRHWVRWVGAISVHRDIKVKKINLGISVS